jgi:alpha-L-rhamnosidase
MASEWIFNGQWIMDKPFDYRMEDQDYYTNNPHTLLKKTFFLENVAEAKLYVASLGYYLCFINDQRVGKAELNSDWTNYTCCIYYDEYDITSYLKKGENTILFELGNGMYNPAPLKLFGKYNLRERLAEVGDPRLICDMVMNDSLIVSSDHSWEAKQGNLLFNNLYLGEKIDFTKESGSWASVNVARFTQQSLMKKSFIPKIKKQASMNATKITPFKEGIFVDFEETLSGFICATFDCISEKKIRIKYAEDFCNGQFDFGSSYAGSVGATIRNGRISGGSGAPKEGLQQDVLICKKGRNIFENRFTYHSFRYAYIEGCSLEEITEIKGIPVFTEVKQVGFIHTDHSFYKELYQASIHTKRNNIHSVFEDCARERLGYGGDMVALAKSNLYQFNLETLLKKTINDFHYEQTEFGGIPETAPYMGIQTNGTGPKEGPLLWQLVYPYVVAKHYQFYGDLAFVEQQYPFIKKQLNYLLSREIDELAKCCIGDHGSPLIAGNFSAQTPDKEFVGYCTILLFIHWNIRLREILNKKSVWLEQQYDRIKTLINCRFLNEDGSYGEGTQTSYIFALYTNLGNSEILATNLRKTIEENQFVFDSGIFGHAFAYEVLNNYDMNDLVEKWLLQESAISFKKMLENGNKVLSELFTGTQLSKNHAMFASYPQWYMEAVAGLTIAEEAIACSKVIVSPYFPKDMNHFKMEFEAKSGIFKVSWERKAGQLIYRLSYPEAVEINIVHRTNYHVKNMTADRQCLQIVYTESE